MSRRARLIKSFIQSKSLARVAAFVSGRSAGEINSFQKRLFKPFGFVPLELSIASLGALKPLTVVQVGANDGKFGDPVFKSIKQYACRVMLIEPQPWLIEQLRSNYSDFDGEAVVENIAIGTKKGQIPFHVLKRESWEQYLKRAGGHPSLISSADRSQVIKRVSTRLGLDRQAAEGVIESIDVPVEPLLEVLTRHKFDNLDVLQIDCEGWDFEVIKSIGDIRPPIINFESANLTDEAWHGFLRWSKENDYGFLRTGMDTLALRHFPSRENI